MVKSPHLGASEELREELAVPASKAAIYPGTKWALRWETYLCIYIYLIYTYISYIYIYIFIFIYTHMYDMYMYIYMLNAPPQNPRYFFVCIYIMYIYKYISLDGKERVNDIYIYICIHMGNLSIVIPKKIEQKNIENPH